MMKRKVPFEIAGFVDRQVWIVDSFRGTSGLRWCSFVNDNVSDEDVVPWNGESHRQEPPF